MHMTKHEGDTIIEIVAPDIPTSAPTHQMIIGVYLLLYSLRLSNFKNGLEKNTFPVTFITIACMAGKSINIIYTIGVLITTFAIYFLINYVRLKLVSRYNVMLCSHMHDVRLFISRVQKAMEIELPIIRSDKLLKYVINGYNVCTEIMDIFVLLVQYDMFELTVFHFFASVLRRWIRGASITLLSVTVATDVTEKHLTTCEHQILTKNIRKFKIGFNSRVINYIMLSTIVISDAIITERHEIVVVIGSVGLIIRTAILFIAKFKSITASSLVSQNSANNCGNQESLIKPGSRPSPTNSIFQQQIRQRCRHNVSSASQRKHQATQTKPSHLMMTTNTRYTYKMKSNPCGIAVIINNEEFKAPSLESRSGSSIDVLNLCNLFNYLGFVTQCHNNKTQTEMRHILNDVAALDHGEYDCLMVAILTHGDYRDVLYGTTGGGIVIQKVIETFSSKRCPTLTGKPKIFIIQACRGRKHNQTVQLNDTNDDECDMIDSGPTMHPNISDYLVAYSTIPGHVSLRNKKNGSIFISTLERIFRRYAACEDITTMLERVINEVTKYEPQGSGLHDSRQSPEVRSTLRGRVYFNIGKCKCD